ncbi:MAG: hypothetical protein RJA70_4778, partial [Pseudomonadota bacterium]
PALALLLDWREAEGCDKLGSLLERASISGDYRATVLLARMSKTPDCGFSEEAVEAAMFAVKERPEPLPF